MEDFQNPPLFPFHAWLLQPIYCKTVQRVPRSEDPSHFLFALGKVAHSQNDLGRAFKFYFIHISPSCLVYALKGRCLFFCVQKYPFPSPVTTLWLGGVHCLEQDGSAQCGVFSAVHKLSPLELTVAHW